MRSKTAARAGNADWGGIVKIDGPTVNEGVLAAEKIVATHLEQAEFNANATPRAEHFVPAAEKLAARRSRYEFCVYSFE